jgi:hypothetical protein
MRIFVAVNGSAGVSVPGDLVLANEFRSVYAHPAASGRGRGSALADLIWFWMQPGAHLHQEQTEPGPRYQRMAHCTRTILTVDHDAHPALAHRCTTEVLDELPGASRRSVRLRDVIMPIAAQLLYEIVFQEHCPHDVRDQIVAHATDFLDALKCVRLRHMRHRHALTRYLEDRIEHGTVPHPLPAEMTTLEQALYLQTNFFTTGVVQVAEAVTHVLFELARHPHVQDRVAAYLDDTGYLDQVINETLRMYPLFGAAQRITTADIVLDPDRVLPAGSVLCFNFLAYQRSGFRDPDRYDPDRWTQLDRTHATYLPYGITGNRPCPARGIMPAIIRTVTAETLRRYALRSTAQHTRALTNRAPCFLTPRTSPSATARTALLAIRLRDHWEMLWHSIVQLILGTIMIAQARKQQLCRRYHETHHMHCPLALQPASGEELAVNELDGVLR